MRIFLTVCRVLIWVLLAVTLPFQLGAILSIVMGDRVVNPALLIIATALMVISVIGFFASKRNKLVWMITAAIAGLLFIIVAVWFKDAFIVTVTTNGLAGISWWKAIYRHMTPALIPLLLFPVFWDYHTDQRFLRLAEADLLTPSYFEEDVTEEDAHKPKRSVRTRNRKNSEASQ